MNAESRRVCPSCGNEFSGAVEFCPVCMLRGALAPKTESDVSALGEAPVELLKVIPTVRDAIDAGRPIMKTIRVFVSSTGDVQKERHLADRVMRSIAGEFDLPVSATYSTCQRLAEEEVGRQIENHRPLVLCPYFLEYQRFQPDAGYQGQIPNTAEFAQRRGTASSPQG